MPTETTTPIDLDNHLASIECHLKEIRHDVSSILHSLQDELCAFREREFWRDYCDTYNQE